MAITQRITPWSTPFETRTQFQATFNAAGTGIYDFGFDATQQGQVVLPLHGNYVYLLDRVSFAATTDEGVYLSAIDPAFVFPEFRLRFQQANLSAFANPIPGAKYHDGMEYCYWFYTDKTTDNLLIHMAGQLQQVAALVGVTQIFALLSMVIYQENNLDIITAIKQRTLRGAGRRFYEDVTG